ncbi:MAG: flagellar hook-associated protein FlgK [Firmicutes bacterium]|nr:flagellar hook-associated protein FlgK [Bacillota bacterium]
MASTMSSLFISITGLQAAQSGLANVSHNISNTETEGYTRQQVIQSFSKQTNEGNQGCGPGLLQIGLGVDVNTIRQIRNRYYDVSYRNQNSVTNYYSTKYTTGVEMESIVGELESDYKLQSVLEDMWDAMNELTIHPEGIETRAEFLETCITFLNKVKDIHTNLYNYQMKLNDKVYGTVEDINDMVAKVAEYNELIYAAEVNGNTANDYRDQRNLLIDKLSGLADITVKESILGNGYKDLLINGQELLVNNYQQKIGLRYTSGDYPFVEPVFSSNEDVLPVSNTTARRVYRDLTKEDLSAESDATVGTLKALLVSRGEVIGNYAMSDEEINNYLIPEFQKKLDTMVHSVVTLINDNLAPIEGEQPYDLYGNHGENEEVFVRRNFDNGYGRYDGKEEDPDDFASLYTIDNLEINPVYLQSSGYNYLAFSPSGDIGDTSLLNKLTQLWKTGMEELGNVSADTYYKNMITEVGIEVNEAKLLYETENNMLDVVQNTRLSMSGVSLDEELSTMLKYQHAYNAAAKMINIIDSMIDKVVNGTGRVGL